MDLTIILLTFLQHCEHTGLCKKAKAWVISLGKITFKSRIRDKCFQELQSSILFLKLLQCDNFNQNMKPKARRNAKQELQLNLKTNQRKAKAKAVLPLKKPHLVSETISQWFYRSPHLLPHCSYFSFCLHTTPFPFPPTNTPITIQRGNGLGMFSPTTEIIELLVWETE